MSILRLARLAALSVCAAAVAPCAVAADLPADDSGARAVADFVAAYAGKAALPSIKVKSEGSGYLVSIDVGAAAAALKSAGLEYDPAEIKLHVFHQDDGQWRVELNGMPPITGHVRPPSKPDQRLDVRVETENLKHITLIDPKMNWIASSHGAGDKFRIVEQGPGVEEFAEFGPVAFEAATKPSAHGLTMIASEPFGALNAVMDVDPHAMDADARGKPVHFSADGTGGRVDVAFADFQPQPILDAWRFAAAHPERADVARDADGLKSVIAALVADHFSIDESFKLDKLNVTAEAGPVAIEGAAVGVGLANAGAGSSISERFSARSLKLPYSLAPPLYAPIIPTSFDFGFKASGFDIPAAAEEWLADAKLDGDGPPLSPEDQKKVSQKLFGSRPIVIEVGPAHFLAPSLDLNFAGEVTIDNSQPSGSITIKVRDFDKAAKAVQQLNPETAQKLVPVLAMAKGLGKASPDGAMSWVCDLGRDKVIKINGLPLGKSPF